MTGSILIMIIGVAVFSSFMTVSKLPMWLGNFIVGVDAPSMVILIFIALLFLVLGTFMPAPAIIMLTMPVLFRDQSSGSSSHLVWGFVVKN